MNVLILVFFISFVSVFIWMYLFNIYEVKFGITKTKVNEEILYEIYPRLLNSFGMEIPFRTATADYEIISNRKNSKKIRSGKGLSIKVNYKERVEIICSTKFNLFPEKIILHSN